jgi:hypothetical protein
VKGILVFFLSVSLNFWFSFLPYSADFSFHWTSVISN